MESLTDRQRLILSFERQWWRRDDARLRELFACSPEQYRTELAAVVELPAALAYDPLLVKRLRRQDAAAGAIRRHG